MTPDRPPTDPPASPGSPLRVLVVRGVDGTGGGADKIILRNAASVDRDRIQMTLCFMRHRDDPEFDFDRRCADQQLDYCEVLHRGAADRSVLPQLREQVRRLQPQIIHSHDYKANFYATLLARHGGPRRLATSHGWTGDGWRERMVYYPGDKLLLSRFPGVIAVSDPIRQTLIRWGARPARVRVLLNGVDPDAYRRDASVRRRMREQLGWGEDQVVLGGVGRVERQKRFDVLLDALALLRTDLPHLKLVIAGDGRLLPELREQVQRLGLNDTVRLLGHCSRMRDLYQALDVLVQSSDYEGTPTVVVEAMAMQIPIVATDVGGTGQLISDQQHGLLVPPRRPDQLASAIRQILIHPAAAQQRVAAARQRVETVLSFHQRVAALQQIYHELAVWGSLDAHTPK
jgi:glycosyltransferase involved in cell wall biosynthesis